VTLHVAYAYVAVWSLACALAAVLVVRHRAGFELAQGAYLRFLFAPWKVATFLLSAGFFVLAAPYTGDPTWDRVDGAMMATLTYATAPWSIGVLYRVIRKKESWSPKRVYVAASAMLFSSSWCYDGYLLARDGRYPATWCSNLFASSILYLCAGLFWNVTYRAGRGVAFAFATDDWLAPVAVRGRARWAMAGVALLFAGIVVVAMLPFAEEILERRWGIRW